MAPIVGIDPGTRKCGYAVIEAPLSPSLAQGIVSVEDLGPRLAELAALFTIRAVALGGGTHAAVIADVVRAAGLSLTIVDERETTLRARARYFQAHPPGGWKRWVPRGMLLPPCPIDDFAALLIAERFLEHEKKCE